MTYNHQHERHNHHHHHHGHDHQARDPGEIYSQEWVQDLVAKIQRFIRTNVVWLGLATSINQRVLDYACGHGTISVALANECPQAVFRGIDSHPTQVERYNDEAAKVFGNNSDRMYAIQGDLDNPSSELAHTDWFNFDAAIISMALHHVPEPVKMLCQLRERLRIGGALTVVEWYDEETESSNISASDNLTPDGMIEVNSGEKIWAPFTSHGLTNLLERAGLTSVDVKKPDVSFKFPENIGGPFAGQTKKLMFVKATNEPKSVL